MDNLIPESYEVPARVFIIVLSMVSIFTQWLSCRKFTLDYISCIIFRRFRLSFFGFGIGIWFFRVFGFGFRFGICFLWGFWVWVVFVACFWVWYLFFYGLGLVFGFFGFRFGICFFLEVWIWYLFFLVLNEKKFKIKSFLYITFYLKSFKIIVHVKTSHFS